MTTLQLPHLDYGTRLRSAIRLIVTIGRISTISSLALQRCCSVDLPRLLPNGSLTSILDTNQDLQLILAGKAT